MRKANSILLGVGLFMLIISCNHQPKKSNADVVAKPYKMHQTIFYNGDIITMEGNLPQYIEALVQQDGRIVFTGTDEQAFKQYENAEKYDLNGKTMLPAFMDGHSHMYNVGFASVCANVLPAPDGPGTNFDELVKTVQQWKETGDGKTVINKLGWIIGNGYDDSQLNEKNHPTKEVLDHISTEVPVLLIHQSGHLGTVNSLALEQAGYNKNTKDMEGGVIRRDKHGNPNGVLEEAALFNILMPAIAKADEEMQMLFVQRGQEEYAKNGYLTAQDGRSTEDVTTALAKAAIGKKLFIDVVSYPDIIWNKQAITPEFYLPEHRYNNHYRIGGVKLTLDGSPQGKTAWLTNCYHVNPEGREGCYEGYPIMEDDKATKYVKEAFQNKWQILCHTNGDAAIDQYLRAVRAARSEYGYDDHRSVMVHGQTLRKDQIPELVELEMLPSLFPMHTFYWGDWHVESVLGEERANYISPCRDVIDAGLTITSHHDAPVTFPNSMRVLDATINRVTRSGRILGPDQRLAVYEGLKTFTEWAAIQYFEENRKGTLTPGKLADLVILNQNPLKIDPMNIHTIEIVESIKEGKTIYAKE